MSNKTDIFNPKNEIKFNYGGQAVIEGVLMRGQNVSAIAARDPEGRIIVHEQPLNKTLYQSRIMRTPFLRGVLGLWDAMGLGTKALMWAADVQMGENYLVPLKDHLTERKANPTSAHGASQLTATTTAPPPKSGAFDGAVGMATVVFSMGIGVLIFFLVPTVAATFIGRLLGLVGESGAAPIGLESTLVNLIEGVIQLTLLIAYIWLIGRMEEVKRLFGYHGAEHKTINAYEAGDELIPEVVQNYPIEHPRCGTAFLLTVVFVSVFIFSLLGRPPLALLILSRVLLIPVIAGVAYEILRWTAKNANKRWVRAMITPNLMLQHLTTRQPDLDMLEVAITAFKRVLLSEGLLAEEEATIPAEIKPQDTLFMREYAKEKQKIEAELIQFEQAAD